MQADSAANPATFLAEQLEMVQIKTALARRELASGETERFTATYRQIIAHMNAATETVRDMTTTAAG